MSETRTSGAISTMRLPELKDLARSLGIDVQPKARKADLVEAIRTVQGPAKRGRPPKAGRTTPEDTSAQPQQGKDAKQNTASAKPAEQEKSKAPEKTEEPFKLDLPAKKEEPAKQEAPAKKPESTDDIVLPDHSGQGNKHENQRNRRDRRNRQGMSDEDRRAALDAIGEAAERKASDSGEEDNTNRRNRRNRRDRNRGRDNQRNDNQRNDRDNQRNDNHRNDNQQNDRQQNDRQDNRRDSGDGEVLIPVAGILDMEGNHAFLRTGGYLPGNNDASVSPQIVRQFGLRRGDALVGAVRQRSERENQNQNRGRNQHRKYSPKLNPLVQVDSINSLDPEESRQRAEFNKLTPLYPQEMLRMETTSKALTARAIDLVAPVGKGQRGLIVSPPKAGKTMVMQQIAKAIATNNPNVHLMVVLVDERPEEVTDMKRLVKGEVIASTFDRPASDHTIVAELAIERAKRLVELGQDVVVLLDSITRLSRAYNLAAPASGRILSGGVDAGALYPPKKFFGAARNIEDGGSLTIIASALVETGSKMDEVIFEEFKGTGNMELRLSRQLADRRIYPAIDVNASGTRREELLFTAEELKVIWHLRRALGTLDVNDASDFLLGRMRKTENNAEFLVSIMRSMQGGAKK